MDRVRDTVPYTPTRYLSGGAWAWLIQRVTSILLLVTVPVKILSGYAAVGKLAMPALAPWHGSAWLDGVILVSLVFHAVYGVRVILVEHGLATKSAWLMRALTAAGVLVCLASLALVW